MVELSQAPQAPQDGQQPRRGGGADGADRASGADRRLQVRVRYFAGAAAAAGLDEEVVLLDHGASAHDLLAHLRGVHPALARVLEVATALVDEVAVTDLSAPLRDGAQVDVLPPFAGG